MYGDFLKLKEIILKQQGERTPVTAAADSCAAVDSHS
jgi:hypothetical protein